MSIRRFRRALAVGITLVGAALLGAGPVAASGTGGGRAGFGAGSVTGSVTGTGTGSVTGTGTGTGTAPGSAGTPSAAPTAFTLCHDHGSFLGLGMHRLAGSAGKNLLVVEVCGDPARHTVSMVRDSYLKVDGPRAGDLRFHWRWAAKAGTVRGGGDDDNGAFALDPQSENSFAWSYTKPVTPPSTGARCVVGVLSEGMRQYFTEPVCL